MVVRLSFPSATIAFGAVSEMGGGHAMTSYGWTYEIDPHDLIPGGAHTYSRGDDTFPDNAPKMLVKGKGAKVWASDGRTYLDWGMGLRSVSLGYANRHVDAAVRGAIRSGVNLTRRVPEEIALARKISQLIPSAQMVKFGKNGSDATAAAVRLARSATGRDIVLRSAEPDFMGIHDWFIGSTVMSRGVPKAVRDLTVSFEYGSLESLEKQLKAHGGQVAAVALEPLGAVSTDGSYLKSLIALTHEHGALVIFDETVSGFRVGLAGAQGLYSVEPDLSTFGKAIANGYALSALAGRRDVMELGGVRHDTARTFLMSSTYGSERVGLAAGLATIALLEDGKIFRENFETMRRLVSHLRAEFKRFDLEKHLVVTGLEISPNIQLVDKDGKVDLAAKTHFMSSMADLGILLSQHLFSVAAAHRGRVLTKTLAAVTQSTSNLARAIKNGAVDEEIHFRPVQRVFREKN